MMKALKIRIYPTPSQEEYLNATLNSCRFLYNQMLGERIDVYEEKKGDRQSLYTHKYKTEKDYKEEYEFLKAADSIALQQKRRDLESAYKNFFRSSKGAKNVYLL